MFRYLYLFSKECLKEILHYFWGSEIMKGFVQILTFISILVISYFLDKTDVIHSKILSLHTLYYAIPIFSFFIVVATGVKQTKRVCELEEEIKSKKAKDELSLKLQKLLNNYNETAGLHESYGIFHNSIVSAMEESGIISESEIFEFKNSFPPCHVLKNECIKIISKLKY